MLRLQRIPTSLPRPRHLSSIATYTPSSSPTGTSATSLPTRPFPLQALPLLYPPPGGTSLSPMGLLVDQLTCALLSEALPDPHGKVAPPAALPRPRSHHSLPHYLSFRHRIFLDLNFLFLLYFLPMTHW